MTIRPWPLFKILCLDYCHKEEFDWLNSRKCDRNKTRTLSQLPLGQQGLNRLMIVTPTALWPQLATKWVDHRLYSWRFNYRRYFEIYSISFHLIFLRKVDGCWSLVFMRHIIHKFVNVYPLIAYYCEVAIHLIISWILGSGPRWYGRWHSHNIQEQGNNYSWVEALPFFLRFSNICLKNCFSDKFFLRAFIFPHAKFLKTRNLHLLWLQTKFCLILTTPWLGLYTKGFVQ